MTDAELIAAGRKLAVKQDAAQLDLGRLALAFAPMGDAGPKTGIYNRLQLYADEIGMEVGTLRNYRAIAHAWAGVEVGAFGYTVLKACASVGDKAGLLDAIAQATAPTKSGRWTADAAVRFAKDQGFWTHDSAPRDAAETLIRAVERTAGSLSRMADLDLNDSERGQLATALRDLALEVADARERLRNNAPRPVRAVA